MKRCIALLLAASTALVFVACATSPTSTSSASSLSSVLKYETSSSALLNAVLADKTLRPAALADGNVVVILSHSDGTHRAYVQSGTGPTLKDAWVDADSKILAGTRNSGYELKYLKADVVVSLDEVVTTDALATLSRATPPYPFGLVLDDAAETVLLPQELDSLRPFSEDGFDVDYLNAYLAATRKPEAPEIPAKSMAFHTRSYLLDAASGDVTNLDATGTRSEPLTAENLTNIIVSAGRYLVSHIDVTTGKFQYLFYPQALADVEDYNLVRHAGALYAMTQYASAVDNDERAAARTAIDAGIAYLEKSAIRDETGAEYVLDEDGLYMLGTAGIILLVLENYENVFESTEHRGFLTTVADGVVNQQTHDGHAPHVLDQNLNVDTDYRTVYFDGEACFGLARAYAATGDETYRTAALAYASYMLANDYWQYQDHWLAYSMNEITKLRPDAREYYELSFKNFYANETSLSMPVARGPFRLELLTATLETYERAVENGITIPPELDADALRRAAYDQARKQLDCYLFPERAMYTAACDEVAGAFYDNGDATWEIRIDTVQHHLSGYYNYIKFLDAPGS